MLGIFRNASMCEDVRDEVGNKKSLMGVFSGDVVVPVFPARIRLAFYAEYLPRADAEAHELTFSIGIASTEAGSATMTIPPAPGQVATLILPQGIAQLEAPGDIVLSVSCKGETTELLRKTVRLV
jgi:hypothetical protein